jgi:hypothetical protein
MADSYKVCTKYGIRHGRWDLPEHAKKTKCPTCHAPLQTVVEHEEAPPPEAPRRVRRIRRDPQEVVIRVAGQGGDGEGEGGAPPPRRRRPPPEEEGGEGGGGISLMTILLVILGIGVVFIVFSFVIGKGPAPAILATGTTQPGGRQQLQLEEQAAPGAEAQAQAQSQAEGGVQIQMQGGTLVTPQGRTKIFNIITFEGWDWKRLQTPAMQQFMITICFIALLALGDGFTNRLGKNYRTVWSLVALVATLLMPNGWMVFLGMIFTTWTTLRAKEAPQTGETILIGLVVAMVAFILYWFGPTWFPEAGGTIRLILTAGQEWRWIAWIPIAIGLPLSLFIESIDGTDYSRMLCIIAAIAIATGHVPFLETELSGTIQTIGELSTGFSIAVYVLLLLAIIVTMKELWTGMTVMYAEDEARIKVPPVIGAIVYLFIVLAVGNTLSQALAFVFSPLHILPPADQWALLPRMMLGAIGPLGFLLHLISEGGRIGKISYAQLKAVLGDLWHFSLGGDEEEAGFFGWLIGADALILFFEVGLVILVGFPALRGIFGIAAGG